jgi:hypothetical protein
MPEGERISEMSAEEAGTMGRWLDILKSEHSNIHLALFLTCGGVLLLHHFGGFPLDGAPWWVIPLFGILCILFGVLFALTVVSAFLSTRGRH